MYYHGWPGDGVIGSRLAKAPDPFCFLIFCVLKITVEMADKFFFFWEIPPNRISYVETPYW